MSVDARSFAAAAWPASLKISSLLGSLLLVVLSGFAFRAIPPADGFTRAFGFGVAAVLPVGLVACALLVVTGYVADEQGLLVKRLFWSTRIPLAGLERVYPMQGLHEGTRRLIGNAGLFSFIGVYQNRALGRFRLYATDIGRSVVLVLPRRTVVVTPAAPEAFVQHLRRLFPASGSAPATSATSDPGP